MFEKDAEEYVMREDVITENDRVPFDNGYGFQTISFEDEVKKGFKDGAEFGYNKANEWHYVKDGDLPKNNMQVLALLENKRLKIAVFMENKFTIWNKDRDTYTKLYNVIKWKEIILPKESE